jgi:hypothetical protein
MYIKCPYCQAEYNDSMKLYNGDISESTLCILNGLRYAELMLKRVRFITFDNNIYECPECGVTFDNKLDLVLLRDKWVTKKEFIEFHNL